MIFHFGPSGLRASCLFLVVWLFTKVNAVTALGMDIALRQSAIIPIFLDLWDEIQNYQIVKFPAC